MSKPLLILVIGVSGSGKSTVAQLLVNALNLNLAATSSAESALEELCLSIGKEYKNSVKPARKTPVPKHEENSKLAHNLQCYHYIDADDFHDDIAKSMMANGQPLTEKQRMPWITRIGSWLKNKKQSVESNADEHHHQHYVLAYSGLKKHHRDTFKHLGYQRVVFHLKVDEQQLLGRLTKRSEQTEHFMPASMLASQFKDFEAIQPDELDVIDIDGNLAPEHIMSQIQQYLSRLANNNATNRN